MKHRRQALSFLAIPALLILGCGSSGTVSDPATVNPSAVTDRRLKFKEEYRKVLDKKGQVVVKPGMYEAYKRQHAGDNKP